MNTKTVKQYTAQQLSLRVLMCRWFLALGISGLASLTVSHIVHAQAYPARTVRVVIPWPPGGSNDIVGRVVMQKLSESLGQQFVVDNRGGASGSIGSDVVAKAVPDGYTIMVHSTTHLGNAHIYGKKLTYDTLKDFTGVGLLSAQAGVLTVHPSLPVKNVKEFIALAKARAGKINYSSSGNGSSPHLQMALLMSMAKINLTHVPYKGGAPQVTALVSGETEASFPTVGTVVSHVRNGKLKALALGSTKPSKALPGVPTLSDAGVPGYDMSPWIGVFAPTGTPRDILNKLNVELNKALVIPEVIQKLEQFALDSSPSTVDQFNNVIKVDYEKYGLLIKLTGAKVE